MILKRIEPAMRLKEQQATETTGENKKLQNYLRDNIYHRFFFIYFEAQEFVYMSSKYATMSKYFHFKFSV